MKLGHYNLLMGSALSDDRCRPSCFTVEDPE